MKFTIYDLRFTTDRTFREGSSKWPGITRSSPIESSGLPDSKLNTWSRKSKIVNRKSGGFTMMEIAISLAVIGIALVAIIGVLPIGMNVQQSNRQETIVGQDASVFMDALRHGSLGYDDLTNYVYAISNYWTEYEPLSKGGTNTIGVNWYTYSAAFVDKNYLIESGIPNSSFARPITNAANIIGLMSTPEFTFGNGNPAAGIIYGPNSVYAANLIYSNHIVVYCHSISGPAIEKPPQDNSLLQQDSFSYRIFCVNAPNAPNTNDYINSLPAVTYDDQLLAALHDLRLTFEWPQLPNGSLGPGRETFRTLIAGQLQHQPQLFFAKPGLPLNTIWYNTNLWTYVSESFTNNP